eukprot:gene1259-1756_t
MLLLVGVASLGWQAGREGGLALLLATGGATVAWEFAITAYPTLWQVVPVLALMFVWIDLAHVRANDRRLFQALEERDTLITSLDQRTDELTELQGARTQLLASISHDLRQPIHALGLFLTALRSMSQSTSVRTTDLAEICRRMQASLDGLGQLLNMLLDVSRLDANAVQVERSPTSAQRLLEELDQDFHHLAAEMADQVAKHMRGEIRVDQNTRAT